MTASSKDESEYDRLIQRFIDHEGNALVCGGAGCGKTTAALRKAALLADKGLKFKHSKALFLSFANATIDRIAQHAPGIIDSSQHWSLALNTYHGFAWAILRNHGYLLGAPRNVTILSPGEENAFRANLNDLEPANSDDFIELFINSGHVSFDYFAGLANEVLENNPILLKAYADAFPIIFLDEFQDTTDSQWALMKTLGKHSRLIALGDPDQRIYDHVVGASPYRFEEFVAEYQLEKIDLSGWNWRSPEGSITKFGQDVLAGSLEEEYADVDFIPLDHRPLFRLKGQVLKAIKRLDNAGKGKSIAILTPSNALSGQVYDFFLEETPPLPKLYLDIHVGKDEAFAASIFVATVMQSPDDSNASLAYLSRALAHYTRTRSSKFSKSGRDEAEKLDREAVRLDGGTTRRELKSTTHLRKLLIESLAKARTGHPLADFLTTVSAATRSEYGPLASLARKTRLVNLITRGGELESHLAHSWRRAGSYEDAERDMRDAVVTYQMQSAKTGSRDLVVMTIHRAKGREFEEVFVYEERYQPFVPEKVVDLTSARYAMNVAVTRARSRATILTPRSRPSRLFTVDTSSDGQR
ncbi:UvrD-helicase domain-containing protein [Arthrobacter castelli]|uniref:UvrD-helicase domain-containing protein n=1 Tax=Arthrobacter castelli TaxID=271431 RepID=UPI00040226D1|nr:UvrD-helicase domain-containing protein [Arthrobacter castelli]